MIKVSVVYPNNPDTHFDFEYYLGTHVPLVGSLLAPAGLRRAEVDRGLGGMPGEPAPFHAMAHLHFDTVEAFTAAFGPHAATILGDIPNYTNAAPSIQISEIVG